MNKELEEDITRLLMDFLVPSFNRSLGALADAGALNLEKLNKGYSGVGGKYYDIVTEQMEMTVEYAKPAIQEVVEKYLSRKGSK